VKKSLAFAYVEPSLARQGEEFDVLLLGERRRARIIPESIWDPRNERLKS
jgi:glycine cleavage system aminomethyltransferase T